MAFLKLLSSWKHLVAISGLTFWQELQTHELSIAWSPWRVLGEYLVKHKSVEDSMVDLGEGDFGVRLKGWES